MTACPLPSALSSLPSRPLTDDLLLRLLFFSVCFFFFFCTASRPARNSFSSFAVTFESGECLTTAVDVNSTWDGVYANSLLEIFSDPEAAPRVFMSIKCAAASDDGIPMRPPILICLAAASGEFIGDAWKFAIQLINNEPKSPMRDLLTLQIVKCRSRPYVTLCH